jgi:hypothetical protein
MIRVFVQKYILVNFVAMDTGSRRAISMGLGYETRGKRR